MYITKLTELLLATMLILLTGLTVNITLAEETNNSLSQEEAKEETQKPNNTEKTEETNNNLSQEEAKEETQKPNNTEKAVEIKKDKGAEENKDNTDSVESEKKDNTEQESQDSSEAVNDKPDQDSAKKDSESEEEEESRAQAKDYKNEVKQPEITDNDRNLTVKITETMPFLDVYHNDEIVRIKRIQDKDYKVTNSFARTSRKCPPFCIRPIKLPDNNIETVGELEVLEFLKTKVRNHSGLLIDARLKDWHVKGTIPGSVSIPFTMFTNDLHDINTLQLLELLGAKENNEGNLDFAEAIDIMLYCNGPWCGQSPRAIKNLLKLGYPSEKMFWYRGGMQAWQSFGLTVVTP